MAALKTPRVDCLTVKIISHQQSHGESLLHYAKYSVLFIVHVHVDLKLRFAPYRESDRYRQGFVGGSGRAMSYKCNVLATPCLDVCMNSIAKIGIV